MSELNTPEDVLEAWNTLKRIIEANELDMTKNSKGNFEAGIRARHTLRLLRNRAGDLIRAMRELDKARAKARHAERAGRKKAWGTT